MLDKVEIRGGKMRDGGVRSMVEKEGRCRNVDVEFVECMLCTVNMYNKNIYIYIYGHHPQHLPNSFFEYIYIYMYRQVHECGTSNFGHIITAGEFPRSTGGWNDVSLRLVAVSMG